MLNLRYEVVHIPFRKEFVTSHGSKKTQCFLYVYLSYGPMTGYGACPVIDYADEDENDWIDALDTKGHVIRTYAYNGPQRFWHFLHHLFPKSPYLVSALDIASWDLWGKMKQKSVAELIGFDVNRSMKSDITVGVQEEETLCNELKKCEQSIVKLKWSNEDLEGLNKITQCTEADLRIDLNEAWSADFCQKFLKNPLAQRFEFLEQPCSRSESTNFKALENPFGLPILADESFQGIEDLGRCQELYHGINIKLPKCGGITPALEIIKTAKSNDMLLLLGNMSEGVIGTAALVQISSAFDFLDLDGCLLLDDHTATGLYYENQVASVENVQGIGIQVV